MLLALVAVWYGVMVTAPLQAAEAQGLVEPQRVLYKQTQNADGSEVQLHLHLFKPDGWTAEDRRPAIVFFFGGGWNGGSPSQFYPHARALAARGMVAAAAEYRVRSRNGTPPQACVADGKSAVRYLREHADELGIDPTKIAAGGGSAGGHVAAATALVTGFDDPGDNPETSCVPDLLVLFNPVIDTTPNRGWGWQRLGDDAKAMSPAEGVHADQPPSIVFHGTADTTVPIASARLFKRLSDKAGASCILHEYEGAGHGFFNQRNADDPDAPRNAYYRETSAKMITFLESHHFLQAARLPNLILIVTDDQGWWDVGFNGCTDIPTPNLDRIASEGVRFSRGYVSYCVCGPSRAGLITGRYQDRFGASRNPTIDPMVENNGVPRSEMMISELLKPRGYATMAVGKWHLGSHPNLVPRERGFDEFYGFLSGGHDYFPENLTLQDLSEVDRQWAWYRTKLLHNGERVATDDYLTDELSHVAVDFVERKRDEPFFLYLAYNAPHTPMQATERYLDRFPHIENSRRRTYAAMVSAVDDGVGRVLDKLDELDIADDTLVVFLSDNGGAANNASRNTPLRGHKGSLFEGGLRVPFAMRWPGRVPAGTDYDHPVIALDIAATIVAHAGAAVPEDKPLDGVDLLPYVRGENEQPPHDALFWRMFDRGAWAVLMGDQKFVVDKDGTAHLFNLDRDPGEQRNRYPGHEQRAEHLREAYEAWVRPMMDPIAPGLGSWRFDRE